MIVFQDTLHSAMSVVTKLCGRIEVNCEYMSDCVRSLSSLLHFDDPYVSNMTYYYLKSILINF